MFYILYFNTYFKIKEFFTNIFYSLVEPYDIYDISTIGIRNCINNFLLSCIHPQTFIKILYEARKIY